MSAALPFGRCGAAHAVLVIVMGDPPLRAADVLRCAFPGAFA